MGKKKWILVVFGFGILSVLIAMVGGMETNATSVHDATTIQLNKTTKGTLKSKKDQKFYKVTLKEAGVVTLSIKRNAKASWEGHLQNKEGFTYSFVYTASKNDASGYEEVEVGLPKGTYYIALADNGRATKVSYQFSVKFKKDNYYESESNGTVSNANTIKMNADYKGVISQSDDVDLFKFVVPKTENVIVHWKNHEGSIWQGIIQNSAGKRFAEFTTEGKSSLQMKLSKGTYYLKLQNQMDAVDVPYQFKLSDTTDSLKASQVKMTNNKGKTDLVKVSNLKKGDVVKVYNASSKGKVLVKGTATGSSLNLKVNQLGKKSGKVYTTVTTSPLQESARVAQSYKGEVSDTLKKSQVAITNNKGKTDKVKVTKLAKSDVVKVYNTKGKVLVKGTSKGSSTVLTVKQLGKGAGKVYVTVTKPGQLESGRLTASYKKEK